jgi:type I restriction enzyme M protein
MWEGFFMAIRPVFEVLEDEKLFARCDIELEWLNGTSKTRIRKNIHTLHEKYLAINPDKKILEISTKSEDELGRKLSAFTLMVREGVKLESAYQGSKVFERGGPYTNIIGMPAVYAKSDGRLKNSGALIGFNFEGKNFPNDPPTFFYNWFYITTLVANEDLAHELLARKFDAFTDMAFNPEKGKVNCQAEAAAIFVSLSRQNLLNDALADEKNFLRIVYGRDDE